MVRISAPFDDFRVDNEGAMTTLFRVVPLTDAAKEWVNENVNDEDGFHPAWPTLFIERRYLDDLIEGVAGAGLAVGRRTLRAAGAC